MPDQGRRGIIAGGIVVLVLVAFSVFVLPFAFTTPPPIITRFVATRSFSPGSEAGRSIATVAIRLSEPSNVAITIKDPDDGRVVARLADGNDTVRTKTLAVRWDGTDLDGARVPDGTYAIDLEARAGEKKFSKSRKVVVDTTAPAPDVTVTSTPVACIAEVSAPGEAASVTFAAPNAGVQQEPRAIGPRGSTTWTWNGKGRGGELVPPGLQVIRVVSEDDRGNRDTVARTCWVSHLAARAVPGRPAAGDEVGVVVAGQDDPQVTLTLRKRLGTPGDAAGVQVLGDQLGEAVSGPASTTRITIPAGESPAGLWLLAATDAQHEALIGFREQR